jgi:hypothetical protein
LYIFLLLAGKYWQKLKTEREKQPARISLADKNAPNDEVWQQVDNPTFNSFGDVLTVLEIMTPLPACLPMTF